ncbi:MAG TPA: MaoC family dehydratase N-terminal domain-containing protein [Acidimicrobiia bacterium]|nr:MaoC family dehydratase N-terminal domain-containing protein [Acidimicrobiia bacterium]
MVDKSKVGLTDELKTMPLERGKIREFAKACQNTNPAYVDEVAPPVPPTFLTTVNFWMGSGTSPLAQLDIDLRRLLHGGQEYVFHGPPPRAGTNLTFQTRVDKIYEKEGKRGGTMTFVETVTEFRDPDGRVVAEARSTAIETGQAATKGS